MIIFPKRMKTLKNLIGFQNGMFGCLCSECFYHPQVFEAFRKNDIDKFQERVYSRPYCVLRNTEKISSGPKYGQHIYQKKRPGFPLKSDKINQTTYLIWEGECCVEIIAAPKKSHTELNGTALCAMLASEKLANIEGPI